MSKTKLAAARELINKKCYAEACVIPLLCLLVFIAACVPSPAPIAQMPTLASLPTLTYTPVPTVTLRFTLTNTPTPSDTLTPSLTFTASFTPSHTFTPTPDCPDEAWWAEVEPIVVEFLDTAEIAAQTSRIAIAPILLEMRRAYRRYENIDYPRCVLHLYYNLLFGMDHAVEGFGFFSAQSESLADVNFDLANAYFFAAALQLQPIAYDADIRLRFTQFTWGGAESNESTATALRQTSTPTLAVTVDLATPPPDYPREGHIDGRGVRVRAEPSSNSAQIRVALANESVFVLGVSGDWYQVQFNDGAVGWVYGAFLVVGELVGG